MCKTVNRNPDIPLQEGRSVGGFSVPLQEGGSVGGFSVPLQEGGSVGGFSAQDQEQLRVAQLTRALEGGILCPPPVFRK